MADTTSAANNFGTFTPEQTANAADVAALQKNQPAMSDSFFGAQSTSPTTTSSSPASNALDNLYGNISSAATTPPTTPTTSNPTGAPTNGQGQYLQYDGTYAANPDPYGFGTAGYNPANDPRVTSATTDANKIYTDRQTALEQQRDAEVARLTQESQTKQEQLAETQKNETGTTNRNITTMQAGGQSASAQAYLNSLEVSHTREMNTLVAQYNNAIQQAKNAFSDKDFALAESMVKNANDIRDKALKRNQDFLNYSLNLTKTINDQQQQNLTNEVNRQDFLAKYNVTTPAYRVGNQLFDSATLQPIKDINQAKALGIKDDLSNVTDLSGKLQLGPGVIGEFQYRNSLSPEEQKQFDDYMNADANRKRTVTNINVDTKREIDTVKAIIDAHPGGNFDSWAQAANDINKTLGNPNAATQYDQLLKTAYLLPTRARDAAASMPANVSLDQWNTARQLFIQQNTYADPDTAGSTFDKLVPKPGAKTSSDNPFAK